MADYLETWRKQHERRGRTGITAVRGHTLNVKSGYQPRPEQYRFSTGDPLRGVHLEELHNRTDRISAVSPSRVRGARHRAIEWLRYIHDLGDISDKQYNHFEDRINKRTEAEDEEAGRLRRGSGYMSGLRPRLTY